MKECYHNPDPISHLTGKVNEAHILVDDVEFLALVDLEAQLSTITTDFVKQVGLKIHQLDRILKFEAKGGRKIPYMGYIEVNLKIPEIKAFNEDVLMLVIEDSAYAQCVPIQLGTLHIDRALDLIRNKEITQMSTKWEYSKLASLLAGKLAPVGDVPEETFSLDMIEGKVKVAKTVELSPFCTIQVHGIMKQTMTRELIL